MIPYMVVLLLQGAILVFLPGWDDIMGVQDLLDSKLRNRMEVRRQTAWLQICRVYAGVAPGLEFGLEDIVFSSCYGRFCIYSEATIV